MFGADMFKGDDIQQVARNVLGCVIHCPESPFPVKEGIITEVQWFGKEEDDPETIEDRQGDALMMAPGNLFIFDRMGNCVMLISALSEKTRACIRINGVQGIADKARMFTRALGITSINRNKYQGINVLDPSSPIHLTAPEIEVPEIQVYQPKRSRLEKGMRISL